MTKTSTAITEERRLITTLGLYYRLTKPGIVYGNALSAIAGYFFGSAGHPQLVLFILMLVGVCLVMASACVFNNVMDKDIDSKMERTSDRSMPTGQINGRDALIFASALLILGQVMLVSINVLTAFIALFGLFAYVVLYGIAKRKTVHSTLVGTISGATPPVIGYTAATGSLDVVAFMLFILLVAWQMPHFYSIAIFRSAEYKAAHIPVLSVVAGIEATRKQIIVYALLFLLMIFAFYVYAQTSTLWLLIMVLAASYWVYLCILPPANSIENWARKQFGWSLITLSILSISLSIDPFLH